MKTIKWNVAFSGLLIFFAVQFSSAQECQLDNFIKEYVELNLKSDLHYVMDYPNDDETVPKVYYSKEKIEIRERKFSLDEEFEPREESLFSVEAYPLSESEFIGFHSRLNSNYIFVEVFFTRAEYLIGKTKSEYENWRRLNAGMSYLFKINDSNCVVKIWKSYIMYE